MLAHRVQAWLRTTPDARLRVMLITLYALTAAADAGGKALAAMPSFNRAIAARVGGSLENDLREAARPSGNFEIFRLASRHLLSGEDMYAEYPAVHRDQFKYSPTFAFFFVPLSALAWPIALFCWSMLNAMVLFVGVERALPGRAGLLALLLLHLEILRAMQNAQSNALAAGLIVLAFVAAERRGVWRTAAAVGLGACIKIFPLAAITFAIPRRMVTRTAAAGLVVGTLLVALPLLVTSPGLLAQQYQGWRAVESGDTVERWFSLMALLQQVVGAGWPNWPVQLAGTMALVTPLAIRRERWDEPRFRFLYLCSVLMFVVLFNHQAERAAYLIAFTGITLWYAGSQRARVHHALYALVFVTMPLMSTLIPGAVLRTPTAMVFRLALPAAVIWVLINLEMYGKHNTEG